MVQTIEVTKEDRVKMYNKLSKSELIEMLIESNNIIDKFITPTIKTDYSTNNPVLYSDICGCNPTNGGNGICGCTMPNQQLLNNNLL